MKRVEGACMAILLGVLAREPHTVYAQSIASAPTQSSSLFLDSEAISRSAVSLPNNTQEKLPSSISGIDLKASTLGVGGDLSLALGARIAVRSSAHKLDFKHSFTIDGITYDSGFYLRSVGVSVDCYPKHGDFRISPGILYFKNTMWGASSVPPGNGFELGDEPLKNSVDDPLKGTASVVFPHKIAPMLTVGFRNIHPSKKEGPRRGLVFPVELGFAYTGAAHIDVVLNGTACMQEDCFTFAQNPEAQAAMQKEIFKLNNRLRNFPVYPIVSIGFGYYF
jgi:hypothetical protein